MFLEGARVDRVIITHAWNGELDGALGVDTSRYCPYRLRIDSEIGLKSVHFGRSKSILTLLY